jgi:hypothetical protein
MWLLFSFDEAHLRYWRDAANGQVPASLRGAGDGCGQSGGLWTPENLDGVHII